MTLADGTPYPTGYLVEEALKPYERFRDAGFDVTVITPDGQPPHAEPYGLSWFFHYPDKDKDYLASVVQDRQFADVLAEDGSHELTREQIRAEVAAQRADSQRLAEERHRKLQEIPGFQCPAALSSLSDAELEFDAVRAGRPRVDG
jgi:putative intracellular protease/amidase